MVREGFIDGALQFTYGYTTFFIINFFNVYGGSQYVLLYKIILVGTGQKLKGAVCTRNRVHIKEMNQSNLFSTC